MPQERVVPLPDAARIVVDATAGRVVDAWQVTSAIRRAVVACDPGRLPASSGALLMDFRAPDGRQMSGVARVRRRTSRSAEVVLDYADPVPARVPFSSGRPSRRMSLLAVATVEPLPPVPGRHVLIAEESTLPLLAARARTAAPGAEAVSFVRSVWSDTGDYLDADGVPLDATWCPVRPNGSEMHRIAEQIAALDGPVQIWAAADPERVRELHRSLMDLGIWIDDLARSGADDPAGAPRGRVA
ncbi:hypothetical protein [Pseudolysinimonas sp.]|uniref:hypothetical protein n=1 Tax=Pseudolysinimonas sp. TaxID=2680009 RepID=UPI003F821FF5